ncbi:integral membrane protein [Colletotrichum cereale]|nr:integral membrane protein [Colletotrichum cereale]
MTGTSRQYGGRSLLLLLLWCCAATVEAQNITEVLLRVPNCAIPCVAQSLSDGNCTLTSTVILAECLCPNIPLQSALSTCVQLRCRQEDQARAMQLETNLCAAYPKESRSNEIKIVAIVLPSIAIPAVALRCVSRWRATGRLWWDDWMAVLATILLAGMASIEITSADLGFGMHYWNIELVNGRKLIQLFYVVQMLYILIQVFAKISILLFFSRIFPARWFQLTVRYFIVILLLHGLAYVIVTAFQCTPILAIWDRSNPNRTCLNVTAIWYSGATFSLLEEIVILFLPIPELVKLQINIRKKMALSFMFSLGSFACITTMIRLKYLVSFSSSVDTTWDNVDIVIWSIVKEFCAIICASFLALRPLLQKGTELPPGKGETMKVISTGESRRSMLKVGNDKFHDLSETPLADDLPPTPIDIADQMAATADGKRQVIFTRNKGRIVRPEFELQDVGSGMKWQKHLDGSF